MKIKIRWNKPIFFKRAKDFVADAMDSTWISGGPYVERFEKGFGQKLGVKQVITTSNGTTALLLALLGLNITSGDEVIIPGFTFVAPANMSIILGAIPVFVDIDPGTWCIDPLKIEKAITRKTKAVIAVHIYGNVCDMDLIRKICRKHKLFLIEDTAEAAFSKYKNHFAGTLGDVGCFSFQATKTIAMGEGGCVTSPHNKIFKRMRIIRDHGMREGKRYWHDLIGHNFRLPNLQAAIGCAQLIDLQDITAKRKAVYETYVRCLHHCEGVTLQHFQIKVNPVVWAMAVKINPKVFKISRDSVMRKMLNHGIETRPGFYPFHAMPLYRPYIQRKLSVSDEVGNNIISLPSFPQLKQEQIEWICQTLIASKK